MRETESHACISLLAGVYRSGNSPTITRIESRNGASGDHDVGWISWWHANPRSAEQEIDRYRRSKCPRVQKVVDRDHRSLSAGGNLHVVALDAHARVPFGTAQDGNHGEGGRRLPQGVGRSELGSALATAYWFEVRRSFVHRFHWRPFSITYRPLHAIPSALYGGSPSCWQSGLQSKLPWWRTCSYTIGNTPERAAN